MTNKRNHTELPAWIYENIQAVADWMKQNDYHDWQVAGIGPLADLMKSAQMLAVERGEFRIRAEKAEAEVVRLRAALDDAACALMRAGAALAEFEGFEKSMERAMRRAQDDCAAAFDAILPKNGQPMTTPNEAAMNGANTQVKPSHEVASA